MRRRLLALAAALLMGVAAAQGDPPEPKFGVRPASFSGGVILDTRGVGAEATYKRRALEAGDFSFSLLATGRVRGDDLFGADPRVSATLLAGLAVGYCAPGLCLEVALRYKVIAAAGAPIDHGPDLSLVFHVDLSETYEVPAQPH